jgi:hypothetical protein
MSDGRNIEINEPYTACTEKSGEIMSVNEEKTKGNRSGLANYRKILENNPKSFIFAKLAEEHLKLGEVMKPLKSCRAGCAA